MANTSQTILTDRDRELLGILYKTPATLQQLLKASETFTEPYTNLAYLGRRLQKLSAAGWVHTWRYATTSPGAVNYYKLTRDGYRQLAGAQTVLPDKSYFTRISPSLQDHTTNLADVIVHTLVCAQRHGISVADFRRENSVVLQLGEERQRPDASWQLIAPTGREFNFLYELDNSTEPVNSEKDRDSIRRKIAFHERLQNNLLRVPGQPRRYRLVFFTKTIDRAYNILSLARELASNRDRRLCFAISVPEFLAERDALRVPCFLDHAGGWQSLIDLHPSSCARRTPIRLPTSMARPAFI